MVSSSFVNDVASVRTAGTGRSREWPYDSREQGKNPVQKNEGTGIFGSSYRDITRCDRWLLGVDHDASVRVVMSTIVSHGPWIARLGAAMSDQDITSGACDHLGARQPGRQSANFKFGAKKSNGESRIFTCHLLFEFRVCYCVHLSVQAFRRRQAPAAVPSLH